MFYVDTLEYIIYIVKYVGIFSQIIKVKQQYLFILVIHD